MISKNLNKQPVALLKSAFNTIVSHPAILFPFAIVAFIQIFLLEVIFFATRYPAVILIKPLVIRFRGEEFLHYPYNYFLLTAWFQNVQIPVYVLFTSFFIGSAVAVIGLINNEKKIEIKSVFKETLKSYVHLLVAGVLSVFLLWVLSMLYGLLMGRAREIRSTFGIYYVIKKIVLDGAPYFNLLISIFVITVFAFVIPFIIIDRKKVFTAIKLNFQNIQKSFWFIFVAMLLPGLLYVPILLLSTKMKNIWWMKLRKS